MAKKPPIQNWEVFLMSDLSDNENNNSLKKFLFIQASIFVTF